ncbi:MAG: helix-turn-helix transcriptional regulator [Acidobacteriaceae bacterium]|nr:helix-turn-helix transcriptional regulator [Acidobacteriaceae bacterium]
MDVQERLGARIRAIRHLKGMTQADLAKASQQQRAYLSQLENGKFSARIDTLHLIAKGLRVTLAEMFDGVE